MASWKPMAQDVIRCDLCVKVVELHCNPCQVNLCEGCVAKHIISQKSKKHEVVPFKERKSNTSQPDCASHIGQKCDMFCKDCNKHVCAKCVTGSHKRHEFVHLDEYIIDQKKSMIEENEELEKSIIPIYERNDSEITEDIKSLLEKYEAIDSQISENGETWHKEIDLVIKRHKSQVNEMKTKDIQTMKNQQTTLRDMLQIARDTLQTNKSLLQTSDVNEIKDYQSRIESLRTVPSRVTMTLPSFTALKIQGEHLYRQFGKLRAAIESEISAFKVKKFDKPHVMNTIDSTKEALWEIAYAPVGKFWIFGEEATMDLLDTQGAVLEYVPTLSEERPYGMTVTRNGDLLYSEKGTTINMIENGKTRTIIRTPGWGTNSMCSTSSGGLIVYLLNDDFTRKRIVKYDAEYKEIISVEHDENGKPLLAAGSKCTNFVAENKNLDICIADTNGSSIIVLDRQGKYRWRYNGNIGSKKYKTFHLRGIATDSQGHIIAADFENHCLHVVDQNGQFICYIDRCGLIFPFVLSIDDDDLLYVGENKTPKAQIKVVRYLQ